MNQAHASVATEALSMPGPALPTRPLAVGSPLMMALSVAFHGAVAVILAGLPSVGRLAAASEDVFVDIDVYEAPPVVVPAPEPEPIAPPEPVVEPTRERRVEPAIVPEPDPVAEITPEPPPPAAALIPSVDEAFGDPPPAMPSLTAEGSEGAFVVPPGEAGGVPGGRAGGTPGGTVGAGGGSGGATASADDGADRRRARDAYKRELERFLREHMSYPRAAAREHIEGRVELALRIGADGSLLGVRVASSSGYDLLDREAEATARECGHMPAPPEPCGLRPTDELRVGMVYRLR
jgi:protein TonB